MLLAIASIENGISSFQRYDSVRHASTSDRDCHAVVDGIAAVLVRKLHHAARLRRCGGDKVRKSARSSSSRQRCATRRGQAKGAAGQRHSRAAPQLRMPQLRTGRRGSRGSTDPILAFRPMPAAETYRYISVFGRCQQQRLHPAQYSFSAATCLLAPPVLPNSAQRCRCRTEQLHSLFTHGLAAL